MINIEPIEQFIRSKVLLQKKLSEVGEIPGSHEIESQMNFAEDRIINRIIQSLHHGIDEINALRFILNEIAKSDKEV